jgi:hypothetical protein
MMPAKGDACRKSLAQVIADFTQTHGDTYDYSKVEYKNNKTKVEIICRRHGSFMQVPSSHIKGHGCMKCQKEHLSHLFRDTLGGVLAKFKEVHGDTYDYSKVTSYQNANTKVEIICREHGPFMQVPPSHINGAGCPECWDLRRGATCRSELESVIAAFEVTQKGKYDYSKVTEYKNAHDKLKIVCHEHGVFSQSADTHMKGHGCPHCGWASAATLKAGHNPNAPAFLYILEMAHADEYFFKLGITNDIKRRRCNIGNKSTYEVAVVALFSGTRQACVDIEQKLLRSLKRRNSYRPKYAFEGQHECVNTNPLTIPGVRDKILAAGLVTHGGNSLELSHRTKSRRKRDALHCTGCDV